MNPIAQSTIIRTANRDVRALAELLEPSVSRIGKFGKWTYGNCETRSGELFGVRWMDTPDHPYVGVTVLHGSHYSEHERDGFGHPKQVKN